MTRRSRSSSAGGSSVSSSRPRPLSSTLPRIHPITGQGYYPTGVDHFGPRSMGHAPTVTSAGYREMKKLRGEMEAANYEKTRTLIIGRFRTANSSASLWIGDPAVYAAIYSTNPSVNPFFSGPFEPGGYSSWQRDAAGKQRGYRTGGRCRCSRSTQGPGEVKIWNNSGCISLPTLPELHSEAVCHE
ncbi:hypothetical protein FOZ62_005365 [Perkinsus olseni]|uniref:Uncharacterized protein n=1 Tax=Perkinsus olseni TaxID=32597 RepID=A0A7J6QGL8_PEROL|nr:hypothetical protein FOZ62_005365 [Perkinsus olseni]